MSNPTPSNTLHIYSRVSTLAQADKGTSLQSQLELGIKKAAELGFSHKIWDEGARSSHHEEISKRPVLFELYESIQSGLVKHLWVYDQSRLSRNDQVASVFRYECNKQGVTLYTKDGQFDLSSPQDKFLKQMLDAMAEWDNTTRSERTRLGKLHRVRTGNWHGGSPPFGYTLESKKLVIEQTEAKWVRRIFKESLAGEASPAIKQLLDSNGVTARRGGLWSLGSIQALLKNSHYTGQYTYKDKKSEQAITVQCPAIVDTVTWEGVQIAHRREGQRQLQKNATTKNFYLLRDLMHCGHCGRRISGRINKGSAESLYYCPNKERTWTKKGKSDTPWTRGTGCGFERSMNINRTDEIVWKYVTELHQKSSTLKEEIKQRILKHQSLPLVSDKSAVKRAEAKVKRLLRNLKSINETLGGLEAQRLLKNLDQVSYRTTVKQINEEKDRQEAELNAVRLELRGENEKRKWVDWLQSFGSEIEKTNQFTDDERQKYVAGLVERIDVKWIKESREHELVMHFRLPIVGDGIDWKDPTNKRSGYTLREGVSDVSLTVSKKDGRG